MGALLDALLRLRSIQIPTSAVNTDLLYSSLEKCMSFVLQTRAFKSRPERDESLANSIVRN